MINNTNLKLPFWEKIFCILIVWGSGTQISLGFSYVQYAIAIVFAIIVLSERFRIHKSMLLPTFVVLVLISISILLNFKYMGGEGVSPTINTFLIIFFPILFAMNKPYLNEKRIETIINTILFFSFLSTFFYILFYVGILPVRQISDLSSASTFYYLLNIAPSDLIAGVYRNSGIFWEPGMYQVFLNFLLIYYLFEKNIKYRNYIIVYLTIMILTTISVSGYALALLIFGLYGLSSRNDNRLVRIASRMMIIVGIVGLMPTLLNLFTEKQNTGSYDKRNLDLFLAWDVFLEHPIFGHGIVNDVYHKAFLRLIGQSRPSSNGLMNLLMGTGIFGAFFFFLCYSKFLRFFSGVYSKHYIIPLIVWLLISINTEPIQYHPFINCLFGMGLAYCYNNKTQFQEI